MKIIKYFSLLLLGVVLVPFSSCVKDEEKGGRFPDFQEAPNMRIMVDPAFGSINADNPSAAKIVLNLFSENVDDIAKVELLVQFFDFSEGTSSDVVPLKDVPLANFQDGVFRGFEISFNEFKTALGLTDDGLAGLDQLTIINRTTMKDGRVYPSDIKVDDNTSIHNVTADITNSTASQSFTTTITVFVQCPVDASFASGKYLIEQVSGPDDPFFGNPTRWAPGEVTINVSGPINRSFIGKYFTFDIQFDFIVTCGTLVVPKTDPGIGCGGPNLGWEQDGVVSYTDDSEFVITLIENVDGACGLPAGETLVLKLTKI